MSGFDVLGFVGAFLIGLSGGLLGWRSGYKLGYQHGYRVGLLEMLQNQPFRAAREAFGRLKAFNEVSAQSRKTE